MSIIPNLYIIVFTTARQVILKLDLSPHPPDNITSPGAKKLSLLRNKFLVVEPLRPASDTSITVRFSYGHQGDDGGLPGWRQPCVMDVLCRVGTGPPVFGIVGTVVIGQLQLGWNSFTFVLVTLSTFILL